MTDITPDDSPPMLSGARPLVGHAGEFIRNPVAMAERSYAECGEAFSIRIPGRTAHMFIGSEHNRFFFSETDRGLSIRTAYPFFVRMFDPAFYFFAGNDEYRRQRALVLPRFQGRQLENYVATMVDEVYDLDRALGNSGEFDLVGTMGPLVMRIAARAFLGREFSARLENGFFEKFRRFSAGMDPVMPGWLPLPHLVRSRSAKRELHRLMGELIRQRRRSPVEPGDFLQTLIEARYDDGEVVPDRVLINLILLFSWAGHETTTGHISWAVIDLLRNPEALRKVEEETHRVLGSRSFGELTLSDVGKLKYLGHALHETERLHPVAFTMARTAAETFEYAGYTIPEGAMLMISPAVTHRLAGLYSEPDRFRPERFEENPKDTRYLVGFGGGVHRCLGVHFAYLEMSIALVHLFRKFEFELLDPNPQPVPGAHTKWPQGPCRVRYVRRAGTGCTA
ncbi:cytochrome P450 [Saccharopolyspora erythraea]|uniref:cytochrome P450 n=1 Tax=Saccharopolyspora erythraea TaxID=1836 RepID=UPI002012393F|nr:cytochrome P450 [Saccharopolyspora erythraea]